MWLIPPFPSNPSENAGYLLLSSPSFDFPALTASDSSTVHTVQSWWVHEKIAQVIRKQTNKTRLFFLFPPSPQLKQHHRLWIKTQPSDVHIKSLVLAISFNSRVDKRKMFCVELVIIKYLLSQSFSFAMPWISRCRLLFCVWCRHFCLQKTWTSDFWRRKY